MTGELAAAAERDRLDPLKSYRDEFVVTDDELIYLDGNSLGRMPRTTRAEIRRVLEEEWADDLVTAWEYWVNLPREIGDTLAPLVGAVAGEIVLTDQTSVNLFKLASAAVTPERPDIVTDDANFPSDIYVLEGVAEAAGGRLRLMKVGDVEGVQPADVAAVIDERVGLVSHSHVGFRSGAIADMAAITAVAHDAGALALWDLSHSVGAIPVDL
ncbi:MAG: aminotransferase class V-fold PLP-dependent enzyme, partial [Acidimicrobiia bacterium]